MGKKRVVITGIGMVTPLGNSVSSTWRNLIAGKSGIGPLTRFNPEEHQVGPFFSPIAGEVKDFGLAQLVRLKDLEAIGISEKVRRTITEFAEGIGIGHREISKMSLSLQYVLAATIQALIDAKLNLNEEISGERGVTIGSAIGGMQELEITIRTIIKGDAKNARGERSILINLAGAIALFTGSQGQSESITGACATGAQNIAQGASHIRNGIEKIVIAGATEAPITSTVMSTFYGLRVLSRGKLGPERSSRPFDARRDGFVMSEGAGILILEEKERAEKRGARIYGEIAGWANTNDAYHETMGNPVTQRITMEQALKMADIKPKSKKTEIVFINAHATGTQGDAVEIEAINALLGKHIGKGVVISNKGQIGHCTGASAAIETIIGLKEMTEGIILPNHNLEEIDPLCQGPSLPIMPMNRRIDFFLKNAFGFGGINSCLVIKRLES